MVVVEAQKVQETQLSLDDFKSVLPTRLFERLAEIRDCLAKGDVQAALEALKAIHVELMANKEYAYGMPVNLYTEELIRQVQGKNIYLENNEGQKREVQGFVRLFLNPMAPTEEYWVENVTRR